MKDIKIGLQKEIVSIHKFIKDLHICFDEAKNHISKKKDEHVYLGMKY